MVMRLRHPASVAMLALPVALAFGCSRTLANPVTSPTVPVAATPSATTPVVPTSATIVAPEPEPTTTSTSVLSVPAPSSGVALAPGPSGSPRPTPSPVPTPSPAPDPTPVPTQQAGCPGVTYFDAKPGDQCADIGGTLDHAGWTVSAGPLVASVADTTRPQLCSQLTAVNDGSQVNLMTTLAWSIETNPAGAASPTTAGTMGGTINETGYIQPGRTAHGDICFADVGHPGQVLIVFYPAANDRAVWITSR